MLSFELHFFFTRKVALAAPARALIVTAGGFGTMDELFEILTLLQCGKIAYAEHFPVVLFPGSFWRRVVNFDVFVEAGVVSPKDLDLIFFTDSVEEATTHITERLLRWEAAAAADAKKKAEAEAGVELSPA